MVCVYTVACIRAYKLFLTSFSRRNTAFFASCQFQKYLHVCMHGHGTYSVLIGAWNRFQIHIQIAAARHANRRA